MRLQLVQDEAAKTEVEEGGGGQFSTIDFPGATLTEAAGINPRGDIVGFYVSADRKGHAYLLSQ